ncbi:alcohol dehydrogenase catalytic domain-containing protein [Streptomyces sp. NPDC059627]
MTITCQAAVLWAPGQPLEIRDVQLIEPQPGEVLVRTAAAGICGTDLHFAVGAFSYRTPTALGHEAGTVAAVGAGGHHRGTRGPGHRLRPDFLRPVCRLPQRRDGLLHRPVGQAAPAPADAVGDEPIRQYLGVSAFAELMVVDAHALIPLSDGISFEAGALLSCCLTTGLATVFNVNRPAPGSTVAVIGAGGAVQGARIAGA